ncbi:BlaI/MecI/CopY family transcriptional regulator [Candidatus Roizmanbacteria bacterium]|nr:BlaI/MecI/CopY family transcriptional regulator [Candidatus Roizmanbacteria bacterium]
MDSRTLGELEQKIMDIVWRCKGCFTRDIVNEIKKKRKIAYTTVATILQRLFDKKLVNRKVQKQGYWYFPRISKESYIKTLAKSFLQKMTHSFGDVAIASFAESLESLPKDKRKYLLQLLRNQK